MLDGPALDGAEGLNEGIGAGCPLGIEYIAPGGADRCVVGAMGRLSIRGAASTGRAGAIEGLAIGIGAEAGMLILAPCGRTST